MPKDLVQGKISQQFGLLAKNTGISEKMFKNILTLMLLKSDLMEKMIARSYLNPKTKRNYWQAYQGRLKQLSK